MKPVERSTARGCLLGGAVGDALGAPIEFKSLAEIRAQFGSAGLTDYAAAYGRTGAITDDTQMTLFTAEGLLRAETRFDGKGICHPPTVLHHAWIRWLYTQGFTSASLFRPPFDGWLYGLEALHSRRAPGRTCVTALEGARAGTIGEPLNSSKGCGGVMRVAPVGLFVRNAFELGAESAAITHGHPSGYLAAGALALIVHQLARGAGLDAALDAAQAALRTREGHEETTAALHEARSAARRGQPSAEAVESLGGGWVAEQALAIAVYCALVAGGDFGRGVLLAVNHSGDSDSTGAIAGNILGTMLGEAGIPARWLDGLELREEITALADDLAAGFQATPEWLQRYPGW